jgi:hypothetical protein
LDIQPRPAQQGLGWAAQQPPLPQQLTLLIAEPAISALRTKLQACFEHPGSGDQPGVTVTFTTRLTLTVEPNGAIAAHAFSPPLKPDLQECATEALRSAAFPQAQQVSRLQVELQF